VNSKHYRPRNMTSGSHNKRRHIPKSLFLNLRSLETQITHTAEKGLVF
jgi:hypothetical protein